MPGVPIEMPSVTMMVLKSIGTPPASRTPRRTCSAKPPRCMLQGVTDDHVFTTAISGRWKS